MHVLNVKTKALKMPQQFFFFPFFFPKYLLPELAPKVWKMFDPIRVIFFLVANSPFKTPGSLIPASNRAQPRVLRALQQFAKSGSEFFISPPVDERITDGV